MPPKKTKKRMRKVSLGFIDLGADEYPEPGKDYPIVNAASRVVAALPVPDSEFKLLRLQLLSLYIEDLPDFTNKNEALLKLGAHTRTRESVGNREELSFVLEFNVTDPAARVNSVTTILTGSIDPSRLRQVCEDQAGLTLGLGIGDERPPVRDAGDIDQRVRLSRR